MEIPRTKLFVAASVLITTVASVLCIAHLFVPTLGIDGTTLGLLVLAALPWLLPLLKSVELPGGVKIELTDVQTAVDKVVKGSIEFAAGAPAPALLPAEPPNDADTKPTLDFLRNIVEQDPALALVGFRIELEKRLRGHSWEKTDRVVPLTRLANQLVSRGMLSKDTAAGLAELISLGNRAAHGADVSQAAAKSALAAGELVLEELDRVNRSPVD